MSSIQPRILQGKNTIQYNQYVIQYIEPTPLKLYSGIILNMTMDEVENYKYIYYFNTSESINYFYTNNLKSFNTLKELPHPNIIKIQDDLTVNIGNGLNGKMIILERDNLKYNFEATINHYGSLKLINSMIIFTQIISAIAHCHSLGIIRNSFNFKDIAIKKVQNNYYNIMIKNLVNTKFINRNPMHPDKAWMTPANNFNFKNEDNFTPERFNNTVEYDGCAFDIYNVGVMLFTILTGQEPFPHNNIEELKQKVLNGDINFPDNNNIPPEVISLIRRMMSVNPNDRPRAMDILNIHWIQLISNRICTPIMFPFGPMSGVNQSSNDESEESEAEAEVAEAEVAEAESESESEAEVAEEIKEVAEEVKDVKEVKEVAEEVKEAEPSAKILVLSCYFCNKKFTKICKMFSHIREYHNAV
jgi:serine/threonine protein kinase